MRNDLVTPNVWNCMTLRYLLAGLFAATLFAQGQQDSAKPDTPPDTSGDVKFTSAVQVVVAPVSVVDRMLGAGNNRSNVA